MRLPTSASRPCGRSSDDRIHRPAPTTRLADCGSYAWTTSSSAPPPPRLSDLWRGSTRVSLQQVLQRRYSLSPRVIGMNRNPQIPLGRSRSCGRADPRARIFPETSPERPEIASKRRGARAEQKPHPPESEIVSRGRPHAAISGRYRPWLARSYKRSSRRRASTLMPWWRAMLFRMLVGS